MHNKDLHFEDMIGRKGQLSFPPKRIISLVPSITETLFELGLEEEIIGITDFCIHPKEKTLKTQKIKGTKNPDIQLIKELKPDLIIADKNENIQSKVQMLMKISPVYVVEVNNYEDALLMITKLGDIINRKKEAEIIVHKISSSFQHILSLKSRKTVFFPIWKGPCMTINKDTFIHSMIEKIGLNNLFANRKEHYPVVSDENLQSINPDFVFLPSEPCNYTPEDTEYCKSLFPTSKIIEVDGQMFAWYGVRLLKAANYFQSLIKSFQ